jgi:hypothetical protein
LSLALVRPGRLAYAVLASGLLAALLAVLVAGPGGWWQLAAFGLGPDVALFAGAGAGLAKGQLHPRAVPLYNLLHRFWGPLALGLVALLLSPAFTCGALAWGFHVAIDRALGYGLRTREGFQRG